MSKRAVISACSTDLNLIWWTKTHGLFQTVHSCQWIPCNPICSFSVSFLFVEFETYLNQMTQKYDHTNYCLLAYWFQGEYSFCQTTSIFAEKMAFAWEVLISWLNSDYQFHRFISPYTRGINFICSSPLTRGGSIS